MDESTASVETPVEQKVVFNPQIATVDVSLPSMPGSRVTLRNNITSKEAEAIALGLPEGNVPQNQLRIISMRATIAAMFVSWNLTDPEGKDLPCNDAVLQRFRFTDLSMMMQAISGVKILDDQGNFLAPEESKKKPSND